MKLVIMLFSPAFCYFLPLSLNIVTAGFKVWIAAHFPLPC